MKLVVNNIELETSDIDGLIFAASNIAARAKACKTYTIEIPATSHNTRALGDIWTVHELRSYKFTAYMRTDTIDIPGVLIVDTFNRYSASGNFVFGVGIVGSLLEGVRLRDVDFSELDHDISDFADSFCDGSLDFVYDLGSRGLYKSTAVGVDEVYPAYNCKKLLEILLSGYNPDLSDVDDSLYVIFTGDKDFRNDKDFEKTAIFEATITANEYYYDEGTGNGTFEIDEDLQFPSEVKDPGSNYNNSTYTYTVPETGTYRFHLNYALKLASITCTTSDETCKLEIYKNGTVLSELSLTVDLSTGTDYHSGQFDTFNIELTKGDVIKSHLSFYGDITAAGYWEVNARYIFDFSGWPSGVEEVQPLFSAEVSRYFGYGSTVEANYLLPDIAATDYVKWLCGVMNLLIYADPLINDIRVVRQAALGAVGTLELDQVEQTIEARKEFQLVFDNDDASGQDEVISFPVLDYGEITEYKTGIARTSIGYNDQMAGTSLPILIQDEEKWNTKLNARVLKLTGSEAVTWELELFQAIYTGLTDIDKIPTWSEIDYESLFVQAANRGIRIIQGVGRLLPEMYTVERYMFPVNVKDIRTGELLGYGYIVKAEQVSGDVYKYTIEI